jgi:hypothetical protein
MECSHCGKEITGKQTPISDKVEFHEVTVIRYYHYHCAYERWWSKMGITLHKSEYRRLEKTTELVT